MKNTKIITLPVLVTAAAFLLTACGEKESTSAGYESTTPSESTATIFLTKAPADAIPVGQARKEAKAGESIVVTGQIGGTGNPIADEYASFIMADEVVAFCNETADDVCTTPWDACCEDPDKLMANRASVVFLAENGQPLNLSLKGQQGLTELDFVTITGSVAPSSTSENLIIHAEGLYLFPKD